MGDILTFPHREGAKLASLPLAEPEKLFSRETLENFTDVGKPKPEFGKRPRKIEGLAEGLIAVRDEFIRSLEVDKPKRVTYDEVRDLSLEIDALAVKARILGHRAGRTAFLLLAQDLDNVGERTAHLAAEFQP